MIVTQTARLTGATRTTIALLASSALFMAGCSNMASTAPDVSSISSAAVKIGGHIHGGNQPIAGATVTLWYAGQRPTAATQAAVTTTLADGSFSFTRDTNDGVTTDTGSTYSCPEVNGSATDPIVYVVAKGGNTQNNGVAGQTNPSAAFIGVYGYCETLSASNFIELNEVTTAATMVAAQQFFNPVNDSLSADGIGQEKLVIANVGATIALLADASGTAVASTPISATPTGSTSPVTVTATPEPGKINLLANILASCINTATGATGVANAQTPCDELFTAAVPPTPDTTNNNPSSYAPATDTLQALFYMLTNPTDGSVANLATIFGLAGGISGPYPSTITTMPTDWTVAINYSSNSTCGSQSGAFISSPAELNIDAADNVWITNTQGGTGNLSAISAAGVPSTCVFLGSAGSQGGGAVDINGSVWVGAGTNVYRYTPSNNGILQFPTPGGITPLGVTTDGLGNVYFSSTNGTTGSLYQIIGLDIHGNPVSAAVPATQISNSLGPNPVHLMPDFIGNATQGNIWVASGDSNVYQVAPSTGSGNVGGFVTNTYSTGGSNAYGLSINHSNNVFVSDYSAGVITALAPTSTVGVDDPYGIYWTFNAISSAGISKPTALVVDGRSNSWLNNSTDGTSTGSVSEVSDQLNGGTTPFPISPSTGFQKAQSYLSSGTALAIDQAGNVWVTGNGANFVTEIVGAGVPLFQPYALGLKNGRFQKVP
jgi:hypothetical protein